MKIRLFLTLFIFAIIILFTQCKEVSNNQIVLLKDNQAPFEKLSEYHFFIDDIKNLTPNNGLIPYDLINSFKMNSALSNYFVYVPKDSIVHYNETSVLQFPIGTYLLRNTFYYIVADDTSKGKKNIETQLLFHQKNGWIAVDYLWNEKQTEAILNTKEQELFIEIPDVKQEQLQLMVYTVVSSSTCVKCHTSGNELQPIGPKVANLNLDKKYADGKIRNQLDKWATIGFFKGLKCPATSPRMPVWNDTTEDLQNRALAYLDVNCAHCHADKNTIDLRYNPQDSAHASFFNACNSKSIYAGNNTHYIKADQPESSAIYSSLDYKFNHALLDDNNTGYHDYKAVQLIYDWIKNMNLKAHSATSKSNCKL